MKVYSKIALIGASLALTAAPALAAGPPMGTPIPANSGTAHMPTNPGSQGTAHKPATPGPKASLPAKAKAYGQYCKTESKTHVAGTPGTPFSKCVTDMAKLAKKSTKNPRTACKNESKTHVAGTPGTPFSQCVSGGAKLLKNQSQR
ncbi:MAG: hypothetical protein ACR2QA_09155 [Solirubrobacteraceae bacterium]